MHPLSGLVGVVVALALAPTCPKHFPEMAAQLTAELPEYLSRQYARLRSPVEVVSVGMPELEPLPLADRQFIPDDPKQLFVAIAERPTGGVKVVQRFYWLFLTRTSRGWRLVMTFMRVGTAPPVDVSDGAIAQSVQRWLRTYCP
ncbi:MAG: hypothetical protein HC919_05430 [Oscillatoriales cyanobacterium SM2_2_1]|nr:hypothetical protein [Oscillatoriales cyanobacterium SM2_2_1]